MKKIIKILTVALSSLLLLTACQSDDVDTAPTPDPQLVKNTINATITLEDGDEIILELYPDLAPETVENFVELANDGFYDGTIFHRVIDGFMIQGGGYDDELEQLKTDSVTGEFAKNGFENSLSHTRGVLSMARAQGYDSATSQFFIVQADATYLDGQYAAFGKVIEGMDIVDEIAAVKTGTIASSNMEDVPIDPIVIDTITIGKTSSTVSSDSKSKSNKNNNDDKNEVKDKNKDDDDDLEDELEDKLEDMLKDELDDGVEEEVEDRIKDIF